MCLWTHFVESPTLLATSCRAGRETAHMNCELVQGDILEDALTLLLMVSESQRANTMLQWRTQA